MPLQSSPVHSPAQYTAQHSMGEVVMELNLSLAASPPSLTALHRGAALVVLEMCLTVAR